MGLSIQITLPSLTITLDLAQSFNYSSVLAPNFLFKNT